MWGARAQSFRGTREYVGRNYTSHRAISFQNPVVQSEHPVEGEHDYVDPYYEEDPNALQDA